MCIREENGRIPDVWGESPPRTKTSKGQLSNCVMAYRCSRTSTNEQAMVDWGVAVDAASGGGSWESSGGGERRA